MSCILLICPSPPPPSSSPRLSANRMDASNSTGRIGCMCHSFPCFTCVYRRNVTAVVALTSERGFAILFHLCPFVTFNPYPYTYPNHVYLMCVLYYVCVRVLNRYPPMRKMFTVLYEGSRRCQLKSIQSLFFSFHVL